MGETRCLFRQRIDVIRYRTCQGNWQQCENGTKQVRWGSRCDLYLLKGSMRMKWTKTVVVDAREESGPRTIKETKIELGDIIRCRLWQTGRICRWFQISTACMKRWCHQGKQGNRKEEQGQMIPLAARYVHRPGEQRWMHGGQQRRKAWSQERDGLGPGRPWAHPAGFYLYDMSRTGIPMRTERRSIFA